MQNSKQEVEILVVEDNPFDSELTLRALKRNNLSNNIVVLTDGAEAMEFIFAEGKYKERNIERSPKLILLDLKLPKVNGLEILKRIKSDPRTSSTPVVVLSSSKEEPDIVESYKLGVNSYITKPVEFEKFLQAVSELGLYWVLYNQTPH